MMKNEETRRVIVMVEGGNIIVEKGVETKGGLNHF